MRAAGSAAHWPGDEQNIQRCLLPRWDCLQLRQPLPVLELVLLALLVKLVRIEPLVLLERCVPVERPLELLEPLVRPQPPGWPVAFALLWLLATLEHSARLLPWPPRELLSPLWRLVGLELRLHGLR